MVSYSESDLDSTLLHGALKSRKIRILELFPCNLGVEVVPAIVLCSIAILKVVRIVMLRARRCHERVAGRAARAALKRSDEIGTVHPMKGITIY